MCVKKLRHRKTANLSLKAHELTMQYLEPRATWGALHVLFVGAPWRVFSGRLWFSARFLLCRATTCSRTACPLNGDVQKGAMSVNDSTIAEIENLVATIRRLSRQSSNGWVYWTSVAKQAKGSVAFADLLRRTTIWKSKRRLMR